MRAWAHSLAALGAAAALPVGLGALALRPRWRVGWRERLGAEGPRAPGAIWVHGASVGEITAATRLVDRLRKAGHRVVTSTTSVTGRDVMRRVRPDVPCQLAPLDHPWCVAAALSRVQPAALVLIETELWPCWIAEAARREIPLVLVSGRLSDRSYPRYRRLRPMLRATLRRFQAIGARTPLDRERFIELGADPDAVSVSGDLKLEPEVSPRPVSDDLARVLAGVPIFVAGSTHPGEEAAALAALACAERAGRAAALVLAPRHPKRADEVEAAARAAGHSVRRRTALGAEPLRAGEVLVLDTLGELGPLYALAAAAFVGGTFAPIGGHNILEPVLVRCPVVYGPHTQNVSHAAEILETCGAGRRLRDASEQGPALLELLGDPERARARGEAGWQAL
ncbi:MAG TPA: glycosyltransferase N-terminal domain-containing protein, partial [Myxococcota bacterium]